jgi:hypothetical protein
VRQLDGLTDFMRRIGAHAIGAQLQLLAVSTRSDGGDLTVASEAGAKHIQRAAALFAAAPTLNIGLADQLLSVAGTALRHMPPAMLLVFDTVLSRCRVLQVSLADELRLLCKVVNVAATIGLAQVARQYVEQVALLLPNATAAQRTECATMIVDSLGRLGLLADAEAAAAVAKRSATPADIPTLDLAMAYAQFVAGEEGRARESTDRCMSACVALVPVPVRIILRAQYLQGVLALRAGRPLDAFATLSVCADRIGISDPDAAHVTRLAAEAAELGSLEGGLALRLWQTTLDLARSRPDRLAGLEAVAMVRMGAIMGRSPDSAAAAVEMLQEGLRCAAPRVMIQLALTWVQTAWRGLVTHAVRASGPWAGLAHTGRPSVCSGCAAVASRAAS